MLSIEGENRASVNEYSKQADLLIHSHEIEVVPGFDDLPVTYSHNRYTGKVNPGLAGGNAQIIARVFTTHGAPSNNFIPFRDHILDDYLNVGKGSAKSLVKRNEPLRAR